MAAPQPTATTTAVATTTSAVATAPVATGGATEICPAAAVLIHAAKLAMKQDKPILLDYYVETATGAAFMGEDAETKEKMLVKSREEFTSTIQKFGLVGTDYIVITENSIYICSGKMQKRKIQANSLRQD
jgi:hypothetical protein